LKKLSLLVQSYLQVSRLAVSRTVSRELAKRALAEVLFATAASFTAVRANLLHPLYLRCCPGSFCSILHFLPILSPSNDAVCSFLPPFTSLPPRVDGQSW